MLGRRRWLPKWVGQGCVFSLKTLGVIVEEFRAYRIDQQDGKIVAGFTTLNIDDLTAGDVVIKVSHSTINYKDALAATGAGRILRSFPLVGGIDLAGVVVSSEDSTSKTTSHRFTSIPSLGQSISGC